MSRFLLIGWIVATVCLFLYSFTQVSLSLTLTQASFWQSIQQSFQYVGFFNRPVSTYIYTILIVLLFALYIVTLRSIRDKKISVAQIASIIVFVGGILALAYNAFSFDIFNYIFDAKIVTQYNENPYVKKALDFPSDPMLSFMHWTHRTYPYGPVWQLLSLPLSYLGAGFFLVTFFLFKGLNPMCYLGSALLIYKIMEKQRPHSAPLAAAFFALNPLVLIEGLVSAHNDLAMIVFALIGIYFLSLSKTIVSGASLLISIGVKFATLFLVPAFVTYYFKKNWRLFVITGLIGMSIAIVLASVRTNYQPWYLLNILFLGAFAPRNRAVTAPLIVLSFGSLLQYVPYLYQGNWDAPVPQILYNITLGMGGLAIVSFFYGVVRARYPK